MSQTHLLPQHLTLPRHLRYEGRQETPRGALLCFTDLRTLGTFCVREAGATSAGVRRAAEEDRRRLEVLPEPPASQSKARRVRSHSR